MYGCQTVIYRVFVSVYVLLPILIGTLKRQFFFYFACYNDFHHFLLNSISRLQNVPSGIQWAFALSPDEAYSGRKTYTFACPSDNDRMVSHCTCACVLDNITVIAKLLPIRSRILQSPSHCFSRFLFKVPEDGAARTSFYNKIGLHMTFVSLHLTNAFKNTNGSIVLSNIQDQEDFSKSCTPSQSATKKIANDYGLRGRLLKHR